MTIVDMIINSSLIFMKRKSGQMSICSIILLFLFSDGVAQSISEPCGFDAYTNNNSIKATERIIQAKVEQIQFNAQDRATPDSIKVIPVVVHVIHDGGSSNISQAQIESQIQVLNEDYGKLPGTNGDGNGVDTRVRFCLTNIDPDGNCTNGIVRINTPLAVHKTQDRALLKELSFWDNTRYMNIYVVKSINGGVGGYSSFPGGPPDEDGMVVRHSLFGSGVGTATGLGRTTSHEIGHWFGLYHTFNNGCGTDVCTDGDYVCDTPPQAEPSFNCATLNTCSNDNPDENDLKENYMNYTPDNCQNMLTQGQKDRMHATLDTIRTVIWSEANLISTGCDTAYMQPDTCPVVANFVTLTPELCFGNSAYFMDISLNEATSWTWYFPGGIPATSTDQNPTVTYPTVGTYDVALAVSDGVTTDSILKADYMTVSLPGVGDPINYTNDFDSGQYPPIGLTINNADGGVTWELDSLGYTSPPYSMRINNLINTNYGSADELLLPYFDLTASPVDSSLYMSFNWAYAKSDPSFSDELIVLLSTDCGATFDQVFYKTQNALATGPVQTTSFVPDSSQWKTANIDLEDYEDETYVLIKIVNITDGGNNLYIDNLYVGDGTGVTGVQEPETSIGDVTVFPNPAVSEAQLNYVLLRPTDIEIAVYGFDGRSVIRYSQPGMSHGLNRFTIPTSNLASGLYTVSLKTETGQKSIKLIVAKP